jgi:hypothetical protein
MQLSWNYRLMFFVRELSFEEILCGLNEALLQLFRFTKKYSHSTINTITNLSHISTFNTTLSNVEVLIGRKSTESKGIKHYVHFTSSSNNT